MSWSSPPLYKKDNLLCDALIVLILTVSSMMVLIDLLAAAVIQSQIQGFLAIDDTKAVWIGKSFFFMAAVGPLFVSHIANKIGFKRTLFSGILLFLAGAFSSGLVQDYSLMLVCRSLAGLGGGIVLFHGTLYISHIIRKERQEISLVIYTNVYFGLGIVLGLLVGGYFGQAYHWGAAFFVNLPLALPLLASVYFLFPETERVPMPRYDFGGFLALVGFCFCMLLIVTQVKAPWNTLGWNSGFIYSCRIAALLFLLLFLFFEVGSEHPLLPIDLFSRPRFSIASLGLVVVGWMVFGVTLSLMSLLEFIYLYQRSTIGWFVSLVGVIYLVGGILTSLLIKKVGPRSFVILGMCLIALSCFMNQEMTILSDKRQIGWMQTVRSIGVSFVLGPLVVLALSEVKQELLGRANAFINFCRLMAATFGSTLISLIIDIRRPFHSLRFGEQVNIYSARFEDYLAEYTTHLIRVGSSSLQASKQAIQLIIAEIEQQAEITAFNDALFLLGVAVLSILAMMILLMSRRLLGGVSS